MKSEDQKYIVFGAPSIGEEEISEVVDSLKSGWLGTGPKTAAFQKKVSEYLGASEAVLLNSCTAALHLSLLVSGIGPGDEVITTPLTFSASANVIIHSGAKPVFVDVNPQTMNIDENLIEAAITDKTKAILPVHLAGRPSNLRAISEIAKKHNLVVIEDAAHAFGADYDGKKIGSGDHLTCFSFYVTKNLTTGEGGLVTTSNKELAEKIRIYSLHGMSKDAWKRYSTGGYQHYDVIYPGYKYNMTDMQAAIGLGQLNKFEKFEKRREEIWNYYNEQFKDLPIETPAAEEKNTKHARHLYTILVDPARSGISRDDMMQELHRRGIGTGVHFRPVHLYSYYVDRWGYKAGDFPAAEYIGERTLSLPLGPSLTQDDVERVAMAVREILQSKTKNHG